MEKFNEIKYVRPDFKELKRKLKEAIKAYKNASSYEEFKAIYKKVEEETCEFETMGSVAYIRNTINVNDKFYEDEYKYISSNSAKLAPISLKLNKVLLASKFKDEFNKEFGTTIYKGLEESQRIMSSKIILDYIKESNLKQKYSKVAATCKTTFRGESCNFYGLLKHMESTDRVEREEAFTAWANLYKSVADELDNIYDELLKVRIRIAKKLKLSSYVEYAYIANRHYDYTPSDVANFRKQVEEVITPFVNELYKKQAKRLGVDKIKYFDENLIFAEGNATPIGNKDELVNKALNMYHNLSKETGEFFDFMVKYDLFDLETKEGKRPGGYCTALPSFKAPFIFSNFNGTSADVDVLTHEAGHAFQAYMCSRSQPLIDLVHSTSDICEIHSMSMEHFAYPYMEDFFKDKADKYRYSHLVSSLCTIPYLVSVDEFQHRVYANPSMSHLERRKVWKEIENKYMPWRDYNGNDFLEEGGFWMQKQHIFLYPFYYVDYALAQICAYQLFIRNLDSKEGWENYMKLCRNGGSLPYFELLKASNIDNPFEDGTVAKVLEGYKKVLKEFENKL